MCHLVLLLPIVALPIFWLMPPALSIPIYAAVLLVAAGVYTCAIKAMRMPLAQEAQLTSAVGRVTAIGSHGSYRVEILGESWEADSLRPLRQGDRVRVTGRDGLMLRVEKVIAGPGS